MTIVKVYLEKVRENTDFNYQISVEEVQTRPSTPHIFVSSREAVKKINSFNGFIFTDQKEFTTLIAEKIAILVKEKVKSNIELLSKSLREWLKEDKVQKLVEDNLKTEQFRISFDCKKKRFNLFEEKLLGKIEPKIIRGEDLFTSNIGIMFSVSKKTKTDDYLKAKNLLIDTCFDEISVQKSLLFSIDNQFSKIVNKKDAN